MGPSRQLNKCISCSITPTGVAANDTILPILLNKNLRTPIIELYSPFNTLPILLLHDLRILIFVHRCVGLHHNHTLPLTFDNYFNKKKFIAWVTELQCRTNNDLHTTLTRSSAGQKCSQYYSRVLWNNLPYDLKFNSFIDMFSKCVRCLIG